VSALAVVIETSALNAGALLALCLLLLCLLIAQAEGWLK
jgi:hypothetical protein